jgi:hypothetical protein
MFPLTKIEDALKMIVVVEDKKYERYRKSDDDDNEEGEEPREFRGAWVFLTGSGVVGLDDVREGGSAKETSG